MKKETILRRARAVARRLPAIYDSLGCDPDDCGIAALELAIELRDFDALTVGFFHKGRDARRHAWATVSGHIVDLTARQFGNYPKIWIEHSPPEYLETCHGKDAIKELRDWNYPPDEIDQYEKTLRSFARCHICRETLGVTKSQWTDCPACHRAIQSWHKISGEDADQSYVYHELAHHVVLFRRMPKHKRDCEAIGDTIRNFPVGRSQLHELRVLALQHAAHRVLGWRPSISYLVDLSWDGISDAARDGSAWNPRGTEIVTTKTAALRRVRQMISQVSGQNVAVYTRALHQLRQERS